MYRYSRTTLNSKMDVANFLYVLLIAIIRYSYIVIKLQLIYSRVVTMSIVMLLFDKKAYSAVTYCDYDEKQSTL